MSKSLQQFLIESKVGNYVAVEAVLPTNLKADIDSLQTSVPRISDDDLHATIVYSVGTTVDPEKIGRILHHQPEQFHGTILHAEKFDSQKNTSLCTIVLEIDCPELHRLHHTMMAIGLSHTYEYKPHVSLFYDIPVTEAETLIPKINDICKNRHVIFAGYRNEELK